MSKSIRIKDYLYEEIQRLADSEHRSLVGQLELLLEQALRIQDAPRKGPDERAAHSSMGGLTAKQSASPGPDLHFKPDFK